MSAVELVVEASPQPDGLAYPLRKGLVSAAVVTLTAIAVELATTRHWKSGEQLIPWFVLGAMVLTLVAATRARSRRARAVLRWAAVGGVAASLFGVVEHVRANYEAGPLDFRFMDRWPTMSMASRVWAATNGSVGPSPLLAPMILAQAAILIAVVSSLPPAAHSPGAGAPGHPTGEARS